MAVRKSRMGARKNYVNSERQTAFGIGRPNVIRRGQDYSPWSAFWTGDCCTFGGGKSGCAPSVSVAAALMLVPVERPACSIFFSVVANGSYETCSVPFPILV